jgi:hypothetical protein
MDRAVSMVCEGRGSTQKGYSRRGLAVKPVRRVPSVAPAHYAVIVSLCPFAFSEPTSPAFSTDLT